MRKSLLKFILSIFVLAIIMLSLVVFKRHTRTNSKTDYTYNEIEKIINDSYLNTPDKEKMHDYAIKGMVSGMGDKYAAYYNPKEYEVLKKGFDGKFNGIGILMTYDVQKKLYKIDSVMEGYGAYDVGIKAGSYILKIKDKEADINTINALIQEIKMTEEGEKVKLELLEGDEVKVYEPEVKEVTMSVVTSQIIDRTIYIKIIEFDAETYTQLMQAVESNAGKFDSIILDLRNNPGGDLNAVIDVTSEFIKGDIITYTIDKKMNKEIYSSKKTHTLTKQPLVILTNNNTASASELLTGAVKSESRGKVVGQKTFGKGVVQQIFPLKNGGAFKQTVAKYYTPDDKNIDGIGIKPDIEVKNNDYSKPIEEQEDFIEAMKIIKQQ